MFRGRAEEVEMHFYLRFAAMPVASMAEGGALVGRWLSKRGARSASRPDFNVGRAIRRALKWESVK